MGFLSPEVAVDDVDRCDIRRFIILEGPEPDVVVEAPVIGGVIPKTMVVELSTGDEGREIGP